RWFKLEEPGDEPRLLELLPENRIGIGSSREHLLRWYVRDEVLRIDGAKGELPPMRAGEGSQEVFIAATDGRRLELRAEPEAGGDALGRTVAALIERCVDDRAISEDETVATL